MDDASLEDTKAHSTVHVKSEDTDTSDFTLDKLVIAALRQDLACPETRIGDVDDLQTRLAQKTQECALLRQRIADLGTLDQRLAESPMAKAIHEMARLVDRTAGADLTT